MVYGVWRIMHDMTYNACCTPYGIRRPPPAAPTGQGPRASARARFSGRPPPVEGDVGGRAFSAWAARPRRDSTPLGPSASSQTRWARQGAGTATETPPWGPPLGPSLARLQAIPTRGRNPLPKQRRGVPIPAGLLEKQPRLGGGGLLQDLLQRNRLARAGVASTGHQTFQQTTASGPPPCRSRAARQSLPTVAPARRRSQIAPTGNAGRPVSKRQHVAGVALRWPNAGTALQRKLRALR